MELAALSHRPTLLDWFNLSSLSKILIAGNMR